MGAAAERLGETPTVERSLAFVILRAIGDPGVAPCPICAGRLDEIPDGVVCVSCGCEIVRGAEPVDGPAPVVDLRTYAAGRG